MTKKELRQLVARGEDSHLQFKADVRNADSLAAEMVAFSNSDGGSLLIGVDNHGKTNGLSPDDVGRINQLISNTASQHIRSPISPITDNISMGRGRVVIEVTIPKGLDKPYFDRKGVIWLKSGADKRRVQSKEELRRLFQAVDLLHADEVPTKATIKALDKLRFRDFLRDVYGMDLPGKPKQLEKLLENLNLAQDGRLNLAGLLLFGEQPQFIKPTCMVKAAAFPGNDVTAKEYLDSEDFEGPMPAQFNGAMGFIMRNLRKIQAGQSVNTLGEPEIPRSVFEELLVNALIHRDYFVSAPIRIFVFTNRIEIISPGHLPNNLTVEKIKAGNSNIRNSTLVTYVAKGLLPYRGLGTGIRRAYDDWDQIDLTDDRDACAFTAIVHRLPIPGEPIETRPTEVSASEPIGGPMGGPIGGPISLTERQNEVLELIRANPAISRRVLAKELKINPSAVTKHLDALKDKGVLKRIGGTRGYWEAMNRE